MSTNTKMHRGLKNRHLQMIALGGAIGTGLFYGSAATIQLVGPAISLAYLVGGLVIFLMMRMLGEMSVHEPVSGSISYFANKYWSPLAGYITGWSYWISYIIISMAELTAVAIYMNFWFPDLPHWISALVTLVVISVANLVNVRLFGNIESAMSVVKVAAIIAMITLGLYLLFTDPSYDSFPNNFSNLWIHGGFLPHGILSIAPALVVVMFSFAGVELISVTAGEVEEPEKHLPTAINQVLFRIMLFYIGTMIVLMALYPWNQVGTNGSPFVLIFESIGITVAAHILNFVVLIAAVSVYNSSLYANARMLYGLAGDGNAPRIFTKLNPKQIPYNAVYFSSGICLVSIVMNAFIPEKVFSYLMSMVVACLVVCWISIVVTHIKFRKYHEANGTIDQLKFKSLFFPYANWICIAFFIALIGVMYTMEDMRPAAYLLIPLLIGLYIGFKMKGKEHPVPEAIEATDIQ